MAVPGHRLQEISDNLCVRREVIRVLRGVSREPAGYCDCENRTIGDNVTVPFHLFGPSLTTLARAQAGQVTAGSSTRSADASTSNIQSASATNRWAIWTQTGWSSRTRKRAGVPERKSCASEEASEVDGNRVSARAVTVPVIPVTIVASRPSPIELTWRHLPMRVKLLLPFDNQLAVSDSVARSRSVLPKCKQRKRIRPADWSLPTCFNRTRAAPNSASFARKTAASAAE